MSVLAPELITITGMPASVTLAIGSPNASKMVGDMTTAVGFEPAALSSTEICTGGVVLRRAKLLDLDAELLAGVLRAFEHPLPVFRRGRLHDDRHRCPRRGQLESRSRWP